MRPSIKPARRTRAIPGLVVPIDPKRPFRQEEAPGGRLLIASNRLPVTVVSEEGVPRLASSSGGLATALKGPHEQSGGIWFGWPGDRAKLDEHARRAMDARLDALGTVPVDLTSVEVSQYYDGFSNGVLWPLFHYLLDKVNLDAERDWRAFRTVNERFATVIAARHQPGDRIWIHDYQLALVPGLLRQRLPDAAIGFFLHVPFPAPDVFRILPWRREILAGLLGADVVGFHTSTYARNFREAVAHVVGVEISGEDVSLPPRRVHTGAFPIGIDVAAFEQAGASATVRERVAELRAAAAGKRIVLGIDRLDYTKGVPRRLLAFDRLLSERPALRERLHFVQLAVPTRESVDAYAELRKTVNELVGRINAQHGSATGAPVHLLYRSVDFNELVALYSAADVMLVTPLRDGMNLVAKEFVAARADNDGVLILSEFAGAATELTEALVVNPYDIGAVARALEAAIEMDPGERRRRMESLRSIVRARDVSRWAGELCAKLDDCAVARAATPEGGRKPPMMPSKASSLEESLAVARVARARTIMLDYDGTLVGFAATPGQAVPDEDLRRLLAALGTHRDTTVHVVSGRDRDSLERWLGDLPIGLHAEHGFWSRIAGQGWRASGAAPPGWLAAVRELMEAMATRTPGALVEVKTSAVAFHHRLVEPLLAAQRQRELRQELGTLLAFEPMELLPGAQVLEVRPRGIHKGLVVERVCSVASADDGMVILAAGDDLTDEDTFRALPAGSIAIKVGTGPSLAPFQVAGPAELRRLLWALV